MAQIGVTLFTSGLTSDYSIIAWREAIQGVPNPPLSGQSAGIANPVDVNYSIINLKAKVYQVEIWESSDGTTLETLRKTWSIDAAVYTQVVAKFYEYQVDRGLSGDEWADPASGQSLLADTRLADCNHTNTRVEMRGIGKRATGEITFNGTGFELVADASGEQETFQEGTWIFVDFYQLTTQQIIQSISAERDILIVNANDDFDDTFYGKRAKIAGSGTRISIAFPDFSLIPNTSTVFDTYGGTQRYGRLQFSAGNSVSFRGASVNYIDLGADEKIEIQFVDGVAYVVDYVGPDNIGQFVFSNRIDLRGHFHANGIESNIADFQRVIDSLPVEMIVSYSDYDLTESVTRGNITQNYYKNRGKFAVNNGTGKFKWPVLTGYTPKLITTGTDSNRLTQGAGGIQAQQIIEHKHVNPAAGSTKRGGGSDPSGEAKKTPSAGSLGADFSDETALAGGGYQAVDNYGQYLLIRI